MSFDVIHDLVWAFVPEFKIEIGPAEILTAIGLTGLIWFEWRTWRKHR